MKALVKPSAAPGLELVDVPEPKVDSGQVLIKVARTGICGTDLHIRNWDESVRSMVKPPVILGHEIAGHVAAVGPGVDTVVEGDLVSVEGHLVCGRCRNCRAGRRQLCPNTKGVGVHRDGGYAEYIAVPAGNVWRQTSKLDIDVAAIFDPFGNAVHSALAFPVLGEDVLVTGAGPIGIMAASVVRHAGARHVVVTDVSDYRLELARTTGVTMAVNPMARDLAEVMKELDMKEGWDVGLEMSGSPAALSGMLETMANGGRIALLGLPSSEEAPFDWVKTITSMLTIKGIYGREMFETWYAMSVLVGAGLDISPVITHRFKYDEWEQAFDTASSGKCGKVLLDWSEV
jgi:threonine 3-dehydrogenase